MRGRGFHAGFAIALALLACGGSPVCAQDEEADVLGAVGAAAARVDVPERTTPTTLDALLDAIEAGVRSAEGAGALVALLGVASPDRCEAIAPAARSVLALSPEAMRRIDEALSRPGPQTDATRRLAVTREAILPLHAARACLWLASCAEGAGVREAWAERAREIGERTDPLTVWAVAERGVILGLAGVILGTPREALEALRGAREALAENPVLEGSGSLAIEVELGTVLATAESRSTSAGHALLDRVSAAPPFTRDGLVDWSLALLAADVAHRIEVGRVAGRGDATEQARLVERSILRYASLLDARATTQPDPVARRRDVEERIRRVVEVSGAEPARLPAIAAASIGAGTDASDPGARERAIAVLEGAIGSVVLGQDPFAPDLFFQLARLSAAGGEPRGLVRAAWASLRFVEMAPADPRAPAALAAACAAALRAPASAEARELSLRALRAAVSLPAPVPHADTWRLQLARLLIEEMRGQPVRSRWPAMLEASGALRAVEGADERAVAARSLVAMWLEAIDLVWQDPLGDEWEERIGAGALSESDGVMDLLVGASLPEAEEARAGGALLCARAHLLLDQPSRALDALSSDAASTVSDPALGARITRARFLALIALQRPDAAFEALDDLAAIDRPGALSVLGEVERRAWREVESEAVGFPPPAPAPHLSGPAEILAHGVRWRQKRDEPVGEALRIEAGTALLLAGRPADAAVLMDTDSVAAPSAERLLVLGEARLGEGEEAAAFDAFRRVGVALDPGHTDQRAFWHAWARMLEILQRRNPEGARSADIRREIARLRTLEAWGAFPDCVERIEAVARAVGP